MITVNGKMLTASGDRPPDATVTISLVDQQGRMVSGFDGAADQEVVGLVRVKVDSAGAWTVDLTPTSAITCPAGATLYRVDERVAQGAGATYYIAVPTSGGPYWVGDLQVPLPGTPEQPALYLPLGGGQMSGLLVLEDGSPAASEQYVADHGGGGGGGTPSGTVVAETAYGQGAGAGAASTFSRGDHTHGTVVLPTPAGIGAATSGHAHSGVYDPAGTASAAVAAHVAAGDPHPQYLTPAEGGAAYDALGAASTAVAAHEADTTDVHGIPDTGLLETAAGSTAKVSTHTGATDPHGDRAYTDTEVATRVPTSRQVIAGTGLTGGGTLAVDRTFTVAYGTSSTTAARGDDARIAGALQAASNLSDVANAGTARGNLGLGGAAVLSVGTTAGTVAAGDDSRITGAAQKSANLSDLGSAATARTNLGLGGAATLNVGTAAGTVAAGDDSRITGAAQKAQNLADLANAGTARTNLGLGNSATRAVGTTAGTVAAGDDSRLSDARTPTAHASTHAAAGSDPVTPAAIGALGLTGGTLTGPLTVAGAAGTYRQLLLGTTGTGARWVVQATNTAESGGNAGSNLQIVRYDDSGAGLDVPIHIDRATGLVGIGGNTAPGATLDVGSGAGTATMRVNRGATTNFAQQDFSTAGTSRWGIGMKNDSTHDFHFVNTNQGLTGILLEDRATAPNISLLTNAKSYGGGIGVIFLPNASTVPSTNPTGGGVLYVQAGALKWRGSSGTVTTIGPA